MLPLVCKALWALTSDFDTGLNSTVRLPATKEEQVRHATLYLSR